MSLPLFIALPGNEAMAARLAEQAGGEFGQLETRSFPDGETYLKFLQDLSQREVVLVCTLARPNDKALPLLFAANAARELGAHKVGLVAPYLCYMRQDRRFQPGEAIASRYFASLISGAFDWLVTVDPHLHRYRDLNEIYSIPARALHVGPSLAAWIKANLENPFLIGPDQESTQWVGAVAQACGAPFAVLDKRRLGDHDVQIQPGDFEIGDATPVLLDDIISSAWTILAALSVLAPKFRRPPVVLAIHGVLAEHAEQAIADAGAKIVTTNSVPNPVALIDISGPLAAATADIVLQNAASAVSGHAFPAS